VQDGSCGGLKFLAKTKGHGVGGGAGAALSSARGNSDRWLSGQKQQTVNLPAHAVYGGSNPPLSTSWILETGN
jgi:hypothetical protein